MRFELCSVAGSSPSWLLQGNSCNHLWCSASGLKVQKYYKRDNNLTCVWTPPLLEFSPSAQELMVSLAAFDLREKSKYSQNLLKILAIFVEISPKAILRVSLTHHIVHVAEPNSVTALCKQKSLQHAKITSVPRSIGRTDRKYLVQIQLLLSPSNPWFLCLTRSSEVVWIEKNN